ncbi:DNA endonuclease RBBP8-like [Neofelis nebulosa]|uniref:DNA endonuclease RBBP8-like n=1 Tax=Neofelis nebulosa TaxID=61452 RepID=UPI00272D8B76|nr:DNA endonuclease RBBP8-like [Neofelis nebulosa]
MMQRGNVGRGNRGGGKKPSGKEKLQLSVCDLSSDEFKKTWLMLKELHDKELRRLQAKLTSLRKERLADGRWSGSIAKIKELTGQQKVLNSTIRNLRDQLNSKECERCSINETYRNTLQQEFYGIQQQNLHFIMELTAERNNLREQNKRLSAKLRMIEQQRNASLSSDEDLIPCAQATLPVLSDTAFAQGARVHLPVRSTQESDTDQPKSGVQKESQESSKFPVPFYSQDLFEVPETSSEMISSQGSESALESSANPKSPESLILTPTPSAQTGYGFHEGSDNQEEKFGRPKRKYISTQRTFTQKRKTRMGFCWTLSSSSASENPPVQLVSETSEENMPTYTRRSIISSFTETKEDSPLSVPLVDSGGESGGKTRLMASDVQRGTGFPVRAGGNQTASDEQSTERFTVKNTNEPTGAGYGANKPQDDTQSVRIKRKARVQSKKREK